VIPETGYHRIEALHVNEWEGGPVLEAVEDRSWCAWPEWWSTMVGMVTCLHDLADQHVTVPRQPESVLVPPYTPRGAPVTWPLWRFWTSVGPRVGRCKGPEDGYLRMTDTAI